MSDEPLTVGRFLFPPDRKAAAPDDDGPLRKVQEKVRKELKSVDGAAVNDALLGKVAAMLDDPIFKVLADAWSKCADILKYRDRTKYPPGETFLVSLAQHSISSVHKPSIDIVINEIRFGTLEFLVTLAIDVEAFQLEIEDATIKRMRTGKLQAAGQVALDGVPIYQKKLEPVRLPLTVDLGEGVRIGG